MILGCAAFAHRGLWSPGGAPENSIAAFRAAAAAGVGIELDVQLSSDNIPVVFHDPMLDRMTAKSGPVWHRTGEELTALKLGETGERIPTLTGALAALPAGTPVLVEMKASPGSHDDYLRAVELALYAARTPTALMSFVRGLNEAAARRLAGHARGVLIAPGLGGSGGPLADRLEAARIDGALYHALWHTDIAEARVLLGPDAPLAAWTIDAADTLETARSARASVIFEHLPVDTAMTPRRA